MEGECVSLPGSSSAPNKSPRRTSEEAPGELEGTVDTPSQSRSRSLRVKAPSTALCPQPSLQPMLFPSQGVTMRGVELKSR